MSSSGPSTPKCSSAIYCFLLQDTIQGQLTGSELLGRTQKFLRHAESNSEQQPSSFMNECFSYAESQVRQTIHLRPRWGLRSGNLRRLSGRTITRKNGLERKERRSRDRSVELLQLRVLCLGFLQDGDVGVGVFPEREEILVGGAGFDEGVRL